MFKSKTSSKQRTNLIVIVSPTIIQSDDHRFDRLGENERQTLQDSSDLPGEPPPVPLNGMDKQARKPQTDEVE
jgi:type II secretory pathway component GspD/PulD (secretin)